MAQTEKSIQRTHKERGFPISSLGWHVGYQYMIYGNGQVKQYRADKDNGAHCKEDLMNFKSIGICLIGDFDKELPSIPQIAALKDLMQKKLTQFKIHPDKIVPHRVFAGYKSCYGNKLPSDWAKKLITEGVESMSKTVVFSKRDTTLKAILHEDGWIGFADTESYNNHIGGKEVLDLELDPDQFDKLKIKDVIDK